MALFSRKNKINREYVVVALSGMVVFLIITIIALFPGNKYYTAKDFGVVPLVSADCSPLKGKTSSSPSISFTNVYDVGALRGEIHNLLLKYHGEVVGDSFDAILPKEDTEGSLEKAYIVALIPSLQKEFLKEVTDFVEQDGGAVENYQSFPTLGEPENGLYLSCLELLRTVALNEIQTELFFRELKYERNPERISLLSQSLTSARSKLNIAIDSVNSFFGKAGKQSIEIYINDPSGIDFDSYYPVDDTYYDESGY